MSATKKPPGGDKATASSGAATAKPVVPAIPSESSVGEEDPGDFESASIHADDGKRPGVTQPKPGERR